MEHIQHIFAPYHCDWCNGVRARQGQYLNSTKVQQAGSRDDECSFCTELLNHGENLVRHDVCRHIVHEACVKLMVDHALRDNVPPQDVLCAFCRAPMIRIEFPSSGTRFRSIPTEASTNQNVLDALPSFLDGHRGIHAVPKAILQRSLRDLEAQGGGIYTQQLLLHRDHYLRRLTNTNEFPHHRISIASDPNVSESIVFQSATKIYAGALRFTYCPHFARLILLCPLGYFYWCETLYAAGWDPVTGSGNRRLSILELPAPPTLDRILVVMTNKMQQRGIDRMEISAAEIAHMYHDHPVVQQSKKLFVRLTVNNADRPTFNAGICAYEIVDNGDMPHDWAAPQHARSNLRINLGPARALDFGQAWIFFNLLLGETNSYLPGNIAVVPLSDNAAMVQYESNLHYTKYHDVNHPAIEEGEGLNM